MRTSADFNDRIPAEGRERALLAGAAALLAADLTPINLFEALCELLARFVDASVVFIALHDGGELRIVHVHEHGEIRRQTDIVLDRRSRSWRTLRTGQPILYREPADWKLDDTPRFPINDDRPWTDDSVSAVFVPLRAAGDRLGVVSVQSTAARAYDDTDVTLLETIARYLSIAVRNQQLFERVRRSAEIEPVTGLYSHSRILRTIDEGLRDISVGALGIITLDITNFGMINDTHGAANGDYVLAMVADCLQKIGDDRTLVGRLAGDDFIVVARRDTREEISALVQETVEVTRSLSLAVGSRSVPISINCGYVVAPDEGRSRSQLMALADLRLRLSVQSGGDVVGSDLSEIRRFGEYSGVEEIVEAALNRDPYTRVHLIHVNHLANAWADTLQLDPVTRETFVKASLLHDIGKLLISDSILLKPARLTVEEFVTMRRHAAFGEKILRGEPDYEEIATIVGAHHEWYDGNGYPNGTRGEDIHHLARAVSIIDAYSAMTVDRPYHMGIKSGAALAELERCAGTQFDAELVRSFVTMQRAAG